MTAGDLDATRDPLVTLPSEDLPGASAAMEPEWFAVVLFHPHADRIGDSWRTPATGVDLLVGRDWPVLSDADREGHDASSTRGLDDRHVSREACRIVTAGDCYLVRRLPGSSRLRVDGEEVLEKRELARERLEQGCVICLGQRVVLHLRLRPAEPDAEADGQLRSLLPGVGSAARSLRRQVNAVAAADGDVLLIGATGSGKERIARAIHDLSESRGPWVAVNMAAVPADIAAASLFGARKGAYTGADRDREGYFQQAEGGSLFLDEIADTPAVVQPLLLRALQEREVQVLGGRTQRVHVRVIAAMESDPDTVQGILRPALRYRLGAHELRLPALRERIEDLGIFARLFLREITGVSSPWASEIGSGDSGDGGGARLPSAPSVLHWARCFELMALHAWPGNLRELRQVVGQIVATGLDEPRLPVQFLPQTAGPGTTGRASDAGTRRASPEASVQEPAISPSDYPDQPGLKYSKLAVPRVPLAKMDDEAFTAAWIRARFEVATAARDLKVSRAAIYRRLERSPDCRLARDVPLGELLSALDQCGGDVEAAADRLAVSRRGLAARLRASGVETALTTAAPSDTAD